MLRFWSKVAGELEAGRNVFVTFVVGHKKGSPGTEGASLLYTKHEGQFGTIGGGAMEARLIENAKLALDSGAWGPTLETLWHRKAEGSPSGLICGGAQTQVSCVLDQSHKELVSEIKRRLDAGEPGLLKLSASGVSLADEDFAEKSVGFSEENNDWTAWIGLFNRRRLLVVGCGHCGAALARQMDLLGFHVTLVDPRGSLFPTLDLPERIVNEIESYSEVAQALSLEHARLTFVVVMTPSFFDDVDALTSLLPNPFPFIGVMGSPAKLKKIRGELKSRNFGHVDWSRLTAPVGLPIDSDTPEEIAVSIAAQILQKTKYLSFK